MFKPREYDPILLFRRDNADTFTPHRFVLAVLIREYCVFKHATAAEKVNPKQKRDFCILILKLIQSPDLDYPELRSHLNQYNIDKRLIDHFEITLKTLHTIGVNYMLDLVGYINRLTTEYLSNNLWCEINKNSVLGTYIRRQMVYFQRLSFSEVTNLYAAFKSYFDPGKHLPKKLDITERDIEDELSESLRNTRIGSNVWGECKQWSRRQAELFIATQANILSINENKALPPNELQVNIKRLLESNPDLSEAHFLNYLNYLRVKEYCGAMDSLYHCFDRQSANGDGKTIEEKTKSFRYAALNLAALNVQFGRRDEALAALKEAIMLAQETNDNICLQHALMWLYRLSIQNRELLMEHSVLKSCNLNMNYNVILGMQSYAQHAAIFGSEPKYIFETMSQSGILAINLSSPDLIVNSYAQLAGLWSLYGKTDMASMWSQQLLHLTSDAICPGDDYNAEGTCNAYCTLVTALALQGEYTLARVVLNRAQLVFPHEPLSNCWRPALHLLEFWRALHTGSIMAAERAATYLAGMDAPESLLRRAELALAQGDGDAARRFTEQATDYCKDPKYKLSSYVMTRALILQAESYPADNPKRLDLLERVISFAESCHLDYELSLAMLHLANTRLAQGLSFQAMKILDKCLVKIFAHGSVYDRARAWLLLVKCKVHISQTLPFDERKKVIESCARMTDKARELFEQVENHSRVKDTIFLQAVLYNEIGMLEERNNAALKLRTYSNEFPTETLKPVVYAL